MSNKKFSNLKNALRRNTVEMEHTPMFMIESDDDFYSITFKGTSKNMQNFITEIENNYKFKEDVIKNGNDFIVHMNRVINAPRTTKHDLQNSIKRFFDIYVDYILELEGKKSP